MDQPQSILTAILLTPLIGSVAIALMPPEWARKLAITFSTLLLVLSAFATQSFKANTAGYQFEQVVTWITSPFPVQYHVGVDGLSLCLVVLTAFVTLMAVMASTAIGDNRPKLFYSFVMLLTLSILGVFVSLDLLQFFVMYELELVPMYFLIAIWGGPQTQLCGDEIPSIHILRRRAHAGRAALSVLLAIDRQPWIGNL